MAMAIETAVKASAMPGQYQQQQHEGGAAGNGGGAAAAPAAAAATKPRQVVHALQLVRGRPFYGFHMEEQLYIKVVL
jgi:hypothetical protein